MSKRFLTLAMAAALTLGGVGTAVAGPGDNGKGPGPNGKNDKGLCTAYFNGQKKGHDRNGSPGPFSALEESADDGDDENGDGLEDLYNSCSEHGIGGNPGENGRFTECFDGDGDDDDEFVCND